ncbi:MAG TPA: outer membrane beta-barrel protein [Acidobacteriaceae bacterium]
MRFFRTFCAAVLTAVGVFAATEAKGQVRPSAFTRPFSLTVGGEASGFAPDYYINNKLGGFGAYADLNLWHGLGIEGEARWLRFNQFAHVHQDNYLVGPRLKVLHVWRAQPYVKGLVGFSNMDLGPDYYTGKDDNGRFTTYALGGGIDIKVTRKWSVRAIDVEYQKYPYFGDTSISPYGASVGIGYRIF